METLSQRVFVLFEKKEGAPTTCSSKVFSIMVNAQKVCSFIVKCNILLQDLSPFNFNDSGIWM